MPVLFWLSSPFCSALAVLPLRSCAGSPTLETLSWQFWPGSSGLAVLSWKSCHGGLVLPVAFWLSFSSSPVLTVLIWRSFCLSCSACPVPACPVPAWPVPACPVLTVLLWLSCSGCPVLTVLFWLPCPGCPVPTFLFRLFGSGCPVLEALVWFSCSGCPCAGRINVHKDARGSNKERENHRAQKYEREKLRSAGARKCDCKSAKFKPLKKSGKAHAREGFARELESASAKTFFGFAQKFFAAFQRSFMKIREVYELIEERD